MFLLSEKLRSQEYLEVRVFSTRQKSHKTGSKNEENGFCRGPEAITKPIDETNNGVRGTCGS